MKRDKVTLILPIPPTLNHAYITTKYGKRIMTSECRNYKEAMHLQIKSLIRKPFKHLAMIQYYIYWPDNRRRDIDNALKIIRDCLKGSLVVDDSWQYIFCECITSEMDRENPRVEIQYYEHLKQDKEKGEQK